MGDITNIRVDFELDGGSGYLYFEGQYIGKVKVPFNFRHTVTQLIENKGKEEKIGNQKTDD